MSACRTQAIRIAATEAAYLCLSHKRPQTSIGVMFGDVCAKRGKITTTCAKRPSGRDLLSGPSKVHGPAPASFLFL